MGATAALFLFAALGTAQQQQEGATQPDGATVALPQSVWNGMHRKPLGSLDGQRWNRRDLEGRFVLLDFWATWCAPCLAELPIFRKIDQTWPREDLLLLSVSMDQGERRDLQSWLRRHNVAWPQLFDGRGMKGRLAKKFGVTSVPRTVLVDRAGRVVAVDLRGEELLTLLRALLPVAIKTSNQH